MIVGDPIGGKTQAFKVLSNALADLAREGLMEENEVRLCDLPPVSYLAKLTN